MKKTVLIQSAVPEFLKNDLQKFADKNGTTIPDLLRYFAWNCSRMFQVAGYKPADVRNVCKIANAKICARMAREEGSDKAIEALNLLD